MWWAFFPLILAAPRLPSAGVTEDLTNFDDASQKFKYAMNLSVDPCEDFFEFACGTWMARHPIPSYLSTYTNFNEVRERVQDRMKELYELRAVSPSRAIRSVRSLYNACMDKDAIDKVGAKQFLKDLEHFFGYIPILHSIKWQREKFDLTELLISAAKARGLSLTGVFFDVDADLDLKNVTRRLLIFDQGNLALGRGTRSYFLDKKKYAKQLDAYRTQLITRAALLTEDAGIPVNKEKISADIDAVIQFESHYAEIMTPEDERRDLAELYYQARFSDLSTILPRVDWKKFFLSITPSTIHEYINSDPEIVVFGLQFFSRLSALLHTTDPEVLTNYVFFHFTNQYILELGSKYEQIDQDFVKVMYGRKERPPRWKDCVTVANAKMMHASGAMYVRKHFDKESKKAMASLIADLHSEFKEMINENDWMDPETKRYAEVKANEMRSQIGFPDFVMNDKKLDKWYNEVDISPTDSYSDGIKQITRFSTNFHYNRLLEVVDRNEFTINSASVNAYYSVIKNVIILPAGILQPPFFNKNYPKALNYGAIGAILGHEITHGFDDKGRQFDALGSLRSWWEDTTAKNFKKRAQCLIDQYGNVTSPRVNVNINGRLTLGENIADIGGVKEAFRSYKRYRSKYGDEKRIPGFEQFSNEQIFFISYGQVWCGHLTPEAEVRQLVGDEHPIGMYRVNVGLRNQPEFARAFNCSPKSTMNPTERCAVW